MIVILSKQSELYKHLYFLPQDMVEKGLTFSQTRQHSFFSGRVLLQKSLAFFYNINNLPKLVFEKNGRPSWENKNLPFFNLSHSGKMVALALGDNKLGLDIEESKKRPETLWRRVLSEKELSFVKKSNNPHETFTFLWTLREALLKSSGRGLGGLSNLSFDLAKNKAFYEKLDKGNIFSWRFNLDSSLIFISLCICAENQDIKIYSYDNQKFKLISLDLLHKFSLNK